MSATVWFRAKEEHLGGKLGEALRDIQYDKTVVMEPFVMPGGTVGQNIKIWRDIVPDTSEEALDRDAKAALEFERYMLG